MLVNFPSSEARGKKQATAQPSHVTAQLDVISRALEEMGGGGASVSAAQAAVRDLKKMLVPSAGTEQRANKIGGFKYRAEYMLDCVLLTDNLHEPNLLGEVVQPPLGLNPKA